MPRVDFNHVPGAHVKHNREADKRECRDHARIRARQHAAHHRRENHREYAKRRGDETGIHRAVVQIFLHPLWQEHQIAEEHSVSDGNRNCSAKEVALLEEPQVDNRIGFGQFPDEEKGETDHGRNAQHHDHRRRKPVEILAFVEHHLERCYPRD